jgi:hypothetical protein
MCYNMINELRKGTAHMYLASYNEQKMLQCTMTDCVLSQ